MIVGTFAFAQTSNESKGRFQGTVFDSAKASISNATIIIRSKRFPNKTTTIKSDKDGKFDVKLPLGYYDVFVTAGGFAPACTEIEVKKDKPSKYQPRLKPSMENIPD